MSVNQLHQVSFHFPSNIYRTTSALGQNKTSVYLFHLTVIWMNLQNVQHSVMYGGVKDGRFDFVIKKSTLMKFLHNVHCGESKSRVLRNVELGELRNQIKGDQFTIAGNDVDVDTDSYELLQSLLKHLQFVILMQTQQMAEKH